MKSIKTVTVLGANGTMGSLCAGLIAGFSNAKVYMIMRDLKDANDCIEKATNSIKSETLKNKLIPRTYKNIKKCISESDWIFELTAENFSVKKEINKLINKYRNINSIVSTVTSGLSIKKLSENFSLNGQIKYFGTHFFNPPYKLILCELIFHNKNNAKDLLWFKDYLENVLLRKVVITKDAPGFAANRIGFQLINEAAQFSEKYNKFGGIAYIDELMGGFTGRIMAPLATIDLVGLDTYKAIVDHLYLNINDEAKKSFKLPEFINYLIKNKFLGKKTNQGLYKLEGSNKLVFNFFKKNYETLPKFNFKLLEEINNDIADGNYSQAYKLILDDNSRESQIIKYFFARYISYSYSLIGPVVKSKEDIDKVMGYGFNWLPPSALIDLLGGKKIVINL